MRRAHFLPPGPLQAQSAAAAQFAFAEDPAASAAPMAYADYAAVASAAPTQQPIATWKLRLAMRLNIIEQLVVQLLRALCLWPALLQPPLSDAMREEMERAQSLLAPSKHAAPVLTTAGAAAARNNITSSSSGVVNGGGGAGARKKQRSFTGWSSALLHSAAQCWFPTHWLPLSARKTSILEPSLEPSFPTASTRSQTTSCVLLLFVLFWFNTFYLKS
jgi:hypothetical protein